MSEQEFRVLDLASQAEDVLRHVRGWDRESILDWLCRFGQIELAHPDNPSVYRFHSSAGISTGFILEDVGQITLIGDHTTLTVFDDEK
jgi:hypothetical protein